MTSLALLLRDLSAEFPDYEFSTAPTWAGRAIAAQRKDASRPGVTLVITSDPGELRAVLGRP